VFGEISLTGGLRSCSQSERRIVEAGRAGFDRIVVPAADARRAGGVAAGAADLRGAFAALLSDGVSRPPSGATNDEWGV
jgi:predicted ATP-dependent serine protease